MTMAEKLCLSAAFIFFMTGLLTGVWKWVHIRRSSRASAPRYVDIAHRSSLLYSFAALLLGAFARLSVFPDWINSLSVVAALAFFALAIASYILHGILQDTSNQFRQPHLLGRFTLPSWVMTMSMVLLIFAEVVGTLIVGTGALIGIWGPEF
ncbi:hypothetical protein DES49_2790 [Halospina denitrificans]|uniref:Integral membrane protein n=1 Tax=Halospina denitrificans TaxID=332522 RepID=A0A4V3EPM3_9GAMM|nr:hypothetical protein [Halospina denitrificans]TDT37828.1 hypothetical protein DES49_2790 [Halospina denitrificans]